MNNEYKKKLGLFNFLHLTVELTYTRNSKIRCKLHVRVGWIMFYYANKLSLHFIITFLKKLNINRVRSNFNYHLIFQDRM